MTRRRTRRPGLPPQLSRDAGMVRLAGQHLGELGVQHEAATATFGWFGETIRVSPYLSELVMIDVLEKAQGIEIAVNSAPDEIPVEATTLIKDALREFIHPDDFAAFWASARRHGQTSADLMTLTWQLLTKLTDRPTGRPSDFSGGPPVTKTTSGRSQLQAEAAPFIAEETAAGRPDRALQIVRAVEQRGRRTA